MMVNFRALLLEENIMGFVVSLTEGCLIIWKLCCFQSTIYGVDTKGRITKDRITKGRSYKRSTLQKIESTKGRMLQKTERYKRSNVTKGRIYKRSNATKDRTLHAHYKKIEFLFSCELLNIK